MAKAILVIPTHPMAGITSSIIGLFHSLQRQGVKVSYYNPVNQIDDHHKVIDYTSEILKPLCKENNLKTISAQKADEMLSNSREDELLSEIIVNYEKVAKSEQIVLISGLLETSHQQYASELNLSIANALSADVVLVTDAINVSSSQFKHRLEYAAEVYGGIYGKQVIGAIINKINDENSLSQADIDSSNLFNQDFKKLAVVPYKHSLTYPRTLDVANFLDAKIINRGNIEERRIADYAMIARTIPNAVDFLSAGYLIITPSDRDDVIMATTLAVASGNQIAGLILTGETTPTKQVWDLCKPLLEKAKLPVMQVNSGSWGIVKKMAKFNLHISLDDKERISKTMEHFAEHFVDDWSEAYIKTKKELRISPSAFKYSIVKTARAANKTIVLPEGDEPRTIVAANNCANRGIAKCVLLANPDDVYAVAKQQGIELNKSIKIINPKDIRANYISKLIELRKHKGMNEVLAKSQLEDNVMLGTMMLEANEVDGLVSGAVHTTANTIRPPLQIIKTAEGSKLVSSIFFMCLPSQVLVYGDCAINPNPDAEALSEIAIQSADSAKSFGISPRVAMISYSTGSSGAGEDVVKVAEATDLVRFKRPDIIIDGPLQYDAAAIASVAAKKAPNSEVAGKANVFIFPDLNTGNTTYKAVQRSAGAVSIGPMLQGMRMPVNDLSRGALVDDITYTIAITAVQAK